MAVSQILSNVDFSLTYHNTAHVIVLADVFEQRCIIYGHNVNHNNLATFGGFADAGETLEQTLCREFHEETLDAICNGVTLKAMLKDPNCTTIVYRQVPGRGGVISYRFSFYVDLSSYRNFHGETPLNFEDCEHSFLGTLNQKGEFLKEEEKENDHLVAVPLSEIRNKIYSLPEDAVRVVDIKRKEYLLRGVTIPTLKFYLESLN
ncbi:Hypothetical protein HVR_LOCUS706 [uncultured virus]|nr:Hypothetical protein HVR_LOCUS706 [uncultured virus]